MMLEGSSASQTFAFVKIYGVASRSCFYQLRTEHLNFASDQFARLLKALGPKTMDVLQKKDDQGCHLLHYAAQYGPDSICEAIVSYLITIGGSCGQDTLMSVDLCGKTPLHCAVASGKLSVLGILLRALSGIGIHERAMSKARVVLGSILVFAIRAHAEGMAKMLLEHKPDLVYQSCRGETALYCASQAGDLSMADLLVR